MGHFTDAKTTKSPSFVISLNEKHYGLLFRELISQRSTRFETQAVDRCIMQNSDQKIMNLQQRRRQNNNGSLAVHLFLSLFEKNPISSERGSHVFELSVSPENIVRCSIRRDIIKCLFSSE